MKNILITGGTGYFGKGFVRHLLDSTAAERICIFSRDEYKQSEMRWEFDNDSRLRWFVGDVRDCGRLAWAMKGIDTVVHAAALKRVETGEYNPIEMTNTNVCGSANVVSAATYAGVEQVVGISTDKACHPVNMYGASKLIMERLFLAANNTNGSNGPHFKVVRYGNVAGSTGSVIPVWRKLHEQGKTVSITHPNCTRFWMTLDEAVSYVQAAIDGESLCYVNNDLPAYRLIDLAEAMGVTMKEVGLPQGERLHEFMTPDCSSKTAHRMTVTELREALKHV